MSIPMPPTTPPRTQANDKSNGDDLLAFKAQGAQDPFLTNAPVYSDQLTSDVAQSTYGGLEMQGDTTVHGFAPPTHDANNAVSPGAIHAPNISRNPSDQPSSGSLQEWLSPSHHTDVSGYTSSEFDEPLFLQPDLSLVNGMEDWTNPAYHHPTTLPVDAPASDHGALSNAAASAATSNQLLSPVPTSTPSPPSGGPVLHTTQLVSKNGPTNSPQSLTSTRGTRQNEQPFPPLSNSRPGTLNVEDHDQRAHPPSPIVKVSSYTRGDSPSREDGMDRQKPGKRGRNNHLAPEDDSISSDSEEEDAAVPKGRRRTVSVPTSALRNDQGAWLANPNTGQSGLDPTSRGDAYVLSPKEMMARQQLEEKNAEVEQWLSNSEANSDIEEHGTRRFRSRVVRKLSVTSRRRARSTGDPSITGRAGFSASLNVDDSAIPGPGVLIEEQSDEEEDDDDGDDEQSSLQDSTPKSPPAQVNINFEDNPSADGYFPPVTSVDSSNGEQVPRQFVRATPWQNPLKITGVRDMKDQPDTSNAAMMRFKRRAENIETASQAATCGTGGTSEADVESIIGPGGRFNNLRIGRERTKSRTNSLLGHASKFLPKRSSSNSGKRKYTEQTQQQPGAESPQNRRSNDTADGSSTPSALSRRKNSFSRPAHSANSAVMAMTEQIAAIGGGANGVRHGPSPSTSSNPLDHLRRRSKSEVPTSHGSGGLMSLMTSVGGPPMPTLASPVPDKDKKASPSNASERLPTGDDGDDDDDIEDDDATDDKGVVMEFPVGAELIVPSLDGFRTHVRQLNPRLPPALVERIAQEQVRRYKKLVEMRTKHAHAVSQRACPAGNRCLDQGGTVTYLAPRASPKDPDATYGQFQVPGNTDEALDEFSEGAIVPALFPSGVPLPPVTRLPAEFECSLCFKVKKFQKPSDWTKHVHEDLQPFTCSFPECTEPKSFKRKADWVRHESERHRHLEWWTCNMPDCPHTCYRKDNFVQHLVREHKMPDPKAKPAKSRTNKNANGSFDSTEGYWEDELWRRVDECRHISPKQPKDENCRFCGNVCNSWKKLTVHMAKHMEQVAMPVLELVKQVKVSDDTHAEGDKMGDPNHQRQPSDNLLSTPVSSYPSVKPEPSTNSPPSSLLNNSTTHVYSTNAVPAETFGMPTTSQPPLSAQHLQVQDALSGMSSHSGGQLSATAPSYPAPSYSQANAASLGLQQMYHSQPQQQQHPVARGNSVTYPPPFNAIPRHQGTADIATYAQPPVTMGAPYGLDINAAAQHTGFDGQPLYASPVDNMGYTYHTGEYDASGQQIPINHHGQANNMAFPDGTMAQANSYLGQDHGPY